MVSPVRSTKLFSNTLCLLEKIGVRLTFSLRTIVLSYGADSWYSWEENFSTQTLVVWFKIKGYYVFKTVGSISEVNFFAFIPANFIIKEVLAAKIINPFSNHFLSFHKMLLERKLLSNFLVYGYEGKLRKELPKEQNLRLRFW